jgi:hypothetical protein
MMTFARPFTLKGVDRILPPGDYRVLTDEELIEELSFPVYRRVSTMIFVPTESASSVEMVTVDPLDLQAAQERDLNHGLIFPTRNPPINVAWRAILELSAGGLVDCGTHAAASANNIPLPRSIEIKNSLGKPTLSQVGCIAISRHANVSACLATPCSAKR